MNVLVTGGCGYIGSELVPLLQQEAKVDTVSVLDSLVSGSPKNLLPANVTDEFKFHQGDIRDYGAVENAMRSADIVIHLAAITGASTTHDRRSETFAVNLDGTRNVLNAAEKLDVENVVLASSCNIYGRTSSRNLDETTEPAPLNPYAEAKYESEQLLADHIDDKAFDGVALRLSTNYGYAPGIRFNLVVNHFVFRALTGRPLTVYGDGSNWRPFIHVCDAARAYKHAALHPDHWPELAYNVGAPDENYQITEVAEIVRQETEATLDITYLEDQEPGPSYHVDFERLSTTTFAPNWTLRDGVRELARCFRSQSDENRSEFQTPTFQSHTSTDD